jgi:alpha-galactosidase
VRTDRLCFAIDPASLRMQLRALESPVRVTGAMPGAHVAGRRLAATRAVLDGHGEIRTRLGVATRLELRCGSELPIDLILRIDVGDDWPGVALELAIENRGDEPVAVEALEPLCWQRGADAELALPGRSADLRFYRMGYQSWSPAAYLPLAGADARGRIPALRRIHFGPHTPLPRRGLHVSDFATELRAPGQPGLAIGFLTHERYFTHVCLAHRDERVEGLRAVVATEGLPLAPNRTLRAERLWVGAVDADGDGVEQWATRAGAEMQARVPSSSGSGWCTWYHFFTAVRAEDVRRNLEELAPFRGQLDTVQIDDGYQAAVGDWLEADPGFPDGVGPLARDIHEAGFRAGLWLAPFLVSRVSRVAQEHGDWLLRGSGGRPVVASYNPAWEGRICYALDPTHPEALAWLREVFYRVRSWGYDYLKLDFLYAGLLRGRRHDPSVPTVEAYRNAVRAMREAAGPDALLLGCGAPLGPSIGLFEAMRIGPDVGPEWRNSVNDMLLGLPAAPAAENSIRNVLARAALHQRLWINDPDCVLLRDRDTNLDEREVRTLAGVVALSGGAVVASDDMASVSDERRRLLRRLLPSLDRAPRVGAGPGPIPERLSTHLPDGSALVLRVNLGAEARVLPIELRDVGLEGAVHVYDVWGERYLGVRSDPIELEPTPPRGSFVLRLTPVERRPALLGSSLHLGAGALEIARLRARPDGGAALKLRLPGPRAGSVVVQPQDGAPVASRVAFEDELELAIWGQGVEETEQIPDR